MSLRPPADGSVSRYPDELFDALLVVSFGGPEGPGDVLPFLENVTRGRGVPRERLEEVAHHYQRFGGRSPLNDQNRSLIDALHVELDRHGIDLPIYFGNRNWHPLIGDTMRQMAADGVRRALAFFTSAFSSYSGCRQYRENVYDAQQAVGEAAPEVVKIRVFYNHPGFVEANVERVREARSGVDPGAHVVFTAHSIPEAMARHCRYAQQLEEAAGLVADGAGAASWSLAYQSRSGPPQVPWLGPDVSDHLRGLAADGVSDVVVAPIGFLSDHVEVLFDLDIEARAVADELGLRMARAATPGTHPAFVAMIRELAQERLQPGVPRRALGRLGPYADVCPPGCCLPGSGRPSPWATSDPGAPAAGHS